MEFISFNVGNGLIEIAALTALVGSTTAESLTLGNKGAAGLVWATISIFGAVSIVKACIAAATPGWLRETLGVRNKETDCAVGLALDLDMKYLRSRNRIGGAVGIICEVKAVCLELYAQATPVCCTSTMLTAPIEHR